MNNQDDNRMKARRDELLTMIQKEFPDDDIQEFDPEKPGIFSGDGWMVSVERNTKKNKPRVVFKVTQPLMTDVGNGYEKIFEKGLKLAKSILEANAHTVHNTQGVIQLSSNKVEFTPKK